MLDEAIAFNRAQWEQDQANMSMAEAEARRTHNWLEAANAEARHPGIVADSAKAQNELDISNATKIADINKKLYDSLTSGVNLTTAQSKSREQVGSESANIAKARNESFISGVNAQEKATELEQNLRLQASEAAMGGSGKIPKDANDLRNDSMYAQGMADDRDRRAAAITNSLFNAKPNELFMTDPTTGNLTSKFVPVTGTDKDAESRRTITQKAAEVMRDIQWSLNKQINLATVPPSLIGQHGFDNSKMSPPSRDGTLGQYAIKRLRDELNAIYTAQGIDALTASRMVQSKTDGDIWKALMSPEDQPRYPGETTFDRFISDMIKGPMMPIQQEKKPNAANLR